MQELFEEPSNLLKINYVVWSGQKFSQIKLFLINLLFVNLSGLLDVMKMQIGMHKKEV